MSNFLSHDMTARDPIRTEEEELKKRVEINNSRQNVKRVQAPPMEMGPRDFNFDGSPKKDVAPELQPVGERRAVKASARITNGAYQYTPEQLEKMRVQNEAKREELRQFKMKHLEAKKRQEDLEREKDIQLVEENKKKLVIGDVQDAKIQNGRKKPKDHVNERSDNFDIILGQEVKHIFDGFDNGFHSSKQRKHPQKKEKVDQFEQGGQGEMITEDEFMSMGIRKNSISKENSGIDFSTTQSVLNSSRASRATSAQKSTESSRAPTASVHLPPVKSASPQASKSSTVATEDIAVRVPSSNREFGRSNSEDTAKIEHAQKMEKNKKDAEFLKTQIKEKKDKILAEKLAAKNQNVAQLPSVNEVLIRRGIGDWRNGQMLKFPQLHSGVSECEKLSVRRGALRDLELKNQRFPLI